MDHKTEMKKTAEESTGKLTRCMKICVLPSMREQSDLKQVALTGSQFWRLKAEAKLLAMPHFHLGKSSTNLELQLLGRLRQKVYKFEASLGTQ